MTGSAHPVVLEMAGITREYPGVRALDGVDFTLRQGEIHALVGENGAGKSTLLRLLGGADPYPCYRGSIRVNGEERRFGGVADAERAGIAVVYQELSLVGPLTVAENIVLGQEPARGGIVRRPAMHEAAARALAQLRVELDLDTPVEQLGIGRQQVVEIAKALARDARLLVLDEPTAALSDADVEVLLSLLERLRAAGLAVVYVSHRLSEVFRISDRVTVLRDGRTVATRETRDLDEPTVVSMMVGRQVDTLYPEAGRTPGAVILDVAHLSVADPARPRPVVDDVSFSVRAGEVLGIAGLVGAGRTELLMALVGALPCTGDVFVSGSRRRIESPADAIASGIALLTEDRKRLGILPRESVTENITLAALRELAARGITRPDREREAARQTIDRLGIKPADPGAPAGALSGGNQQKVLLGRALLTRPRVLLLDEPTRGIDVAARQDIYRHVDGLARDGMGIVVVSSDLPEVLGLADRVLVLRQGRVAGVLTRQEATPEAVMACATGGTV